MLLSVCQPDRWTLVVSHALFFTIPSHLQQAPLRQGPSFEDACRASFFLPPLGDPWPAPCAALVPMYMVHRCPVTLCRPREGSTHSSWMDSLLICKGQARCLGCQDLGAAPALGMLRLGGKWCARLWGPRRASCRPVLQTHVCRWPELKSWAVPGTGILG